MGKGNSVYKKMLPYQSDFDHHCACMMNHMGWAKMKKFNRRLAKHRAKQIINKQLEAQK